MLCDIDSKEAKVAAKQNILLYAGVSWSECQDEWKYIKTTPRIDDKSLYELYILPMSR